MLENGGAIERRVYRAYWNDGLLDIFAAAGVFAIGIFWLYDLPVGAVFVPVWLVPAWGPCRRHFIEPRLGMVEFSDARQRRNNNLLRLILYVGIGCLVIGIELYLLRDRLGTNPSMTLIAGLPAVLLAVLAVATAALIATPRFLVYAAVLAAAGVTGAVFGLQPGLILVVAGGGMAILAAGVLWSFVRDNPVVAEDDL
ncbi:MAG: hypothetical protein QNJ14_00190 [Woeseiaceae bacterium]|nr:hypothetical protein [Woeseiaceae bacterium]